MLFSLILPIYCVEKYISQCILSCCEQVGVEQEDYEIILVNDSTPDKSIDVAKKILADYPNVNYKIINRPNGGLSAARNTGLNHARGEYIWFIDSDDSITTDALALLKKEISLSPNVEAISFGHYNIYANHRVENSIPNLQINKIIPGIDVIATTSFLSVWSKIYKKELLDRLNISFKEGVLWEDSEFNLRLLPFTKIHKGLSQSLYLYSRRPGSISTSNKVYQTLKSDLSNYDSVGTWFINHPVSNKYMKIVNSKRNLSIIYCLAGIPQLDKSLQKEILSELKLRRKQISKSFWNTSSTRQKLLLPFIIYFPTFTATVFRMRMKNLIAADEANLMQ